MAQNKTGKKRDNDAGYWIVSLVLIFTGFAAPIGVLMLVTKLLGGTKRGRHPYYIQQENQGPVGARTTIQTDSAQKQTLSGQQKRVASLAKKAKRLTILGGLLTAFFGLTTLLSLSDVLYWLLEAEIAWFVEDLLAMSPLMCFTGAGIGCLWAGLRKGRQAKRFRSYLAMIGKRSVVPVSSLSAASGYAPKKVRGDLEDMLQEGFFPNGFLDLGSDRLVLTGEGLQEEHAASVQSPADQENAILSEIRAVNDAIRNEKVSAQIDRIGVITARILDYQKNHPEKAPQLHSFLSYYLPTTLKILRAYGQLESQGVSGQNITAAMERIEAMMDKVVEGFEKQLDQLFQGDAMDITTDVEVLERMLAKDGLSNQQGMTLGL